MGNEEHGAMSKKYYLNRVRQKFCHGIEKTRTNCGNRFC